MSHSILITGQVFPQMLWEVETGGSLGLSDFLPSRGNTNTLSLKVMQRMVQEDTHALFSPLRPQMGPVTQAHRQMH